MFEGFLAVIPALPGYFVRQNSGPWRTVLAWGFSSHNSRPIPISLNGIPEPYADYQIKTPEEEEVAL